MTDPAPRYAAGPAPAAALTLDLTWGGTKVIQHVGASLLALFMGSMALLGSAGLLELTRNPGAGERVFVGVLGAAFVSFAIFGLASLRRAFPRRHLTLTPTGMTIEQAGLPTRHVAWATLASVELAWRRQNRRPRHVTMTLQWTPRDPAGTQGSYPIGGGHALLQRVDAALAATCPVYRGRSQGWS